MVFAYADSWIWLDIITRMALYLDLSLLLNRSWFWNNIYGFLHFIAQNIRLEGLYKTQNFWCWYPQFPHILASGVFRGRGPLCEGPPPFGRTAVIFVTILGLFLAPFRDKIAATSDQMLFFGRKML